MVPETSLLVIDEATHSGTINVKNTDSHPSLLYTDVVDLPDDKGLKLVTTQPVVRLEPGQTQQLRFILQNSKPLDVEHYKRVTFEGIPPKSDDNKVKIGINIRQICLC
jgi:P pilus assembly chaperone PapD